MPNDYLDYVVCQLDKILYFVEGNHVTLQSDGKYDSAQKFHGGFDLHRRMERYRDFLLAGVAGSVRYSGGPFQFSQFEMWLHVIRLFPGLLRNRILHGRYLDVFVTHASAWGIHDQPDLTHQGVKAFLWFDKIFQPSIHIHGHIHYYRPDTITETILGRTRIINTYRYRTVEF